MTHTYSETINPLGYREAMPKPSVEELKRHYAEKYYQDPQVTYANQYADDEVRYFHNMAKVAEAVAHRYGLEKSLLDLGCGEGFFAKPFHLAGWRIACCDFSQFGISQHNPDLLPYFSAGDIHAAIEQYRAEEKRFGLINLQNVLEHVVEPADLLQKLKPLLGEKSALRIMVPNDYSDFQQALIENGSAQNTWFSPPEHLSYFNNQGLANILAHCGYQLLSLQADFPIEIFLANPKANYWRDRSLGKGAHLARIFCQNHLIEKDVQAYVDYAEAAGKLGFGRELIAYAKPL